MRRMMVATAFVAVVAASTASVMPFEEEDESPFVGLLQVEAA